MLAMVLWGLIALQSGIVVPATAPSCNAERGRRSGSVSGMLGAGQRFERVVNGVWIVRLSPIAYGWFLEISTPAQPEEDLSRLTTSLTYSPPNPRQIEGWHFRNAANTGPNMGDVNAPQRLRDFIFTRDLALLRRVNQTPEDVRLAERDGRGWLFINDYTLTPPVEGERASFESLSFSVCLTWPSTN